MADLIEDRFEDGTADGFDAIPLLPKRRLFRTACEGTTLRDRFDLPRPAVRPS